MMSLKEFTATSVVLALFAGVDAGLAIRNQEPSKPSCTDFTPFVYAGCFQDPPSPAPHTLLYTSGLNTTDMTIETCVAFCKGNSYRYAGLEYYGECTCGASVNGIQIDESQCSYNCMGNSTEICGGFNAVSVYQDPTFVPVNDSTISDFAFLGCYSEGYNGRSLAWRQNQLSISNLTVEECLYACKDNGFPFAGVEYAQECYCGVVLGNGTTSIDSSKCSMNCTGNTVNSTEICGGPDALDLYVAMDLESSQPCGSAAHRLQHPLPPPPLHHHQHRQPPQLRQPQPLQPRRQTLFAQQRRQLPLRQPVNTNAETGARILFRAGLTSHPALPPKPTVPFK
ncbi:hypothetical protein G7Y89_g6010 [Cudoniella acicularis]|uniref:WSC domain-containing protein n=1 Tax=Cudoniella acicularis TaxID=354080 RepID=A0A8H4W5Y0_9HELO|nr:hypothetical protein G7Y89_g6010 [Cudoniella acicularis]